MSQGHTTPPLTWLKPGEAFPAVDKAWGPLDPAPGLLAAGGALNVPTLVRAYAQGIFPWFSADQPILWWSTDPRMVLHTDAFRLHRSLRKTIQSLQRAERLQVRFDHDFERVICNCARTPRTGQAGTWILPEMVQAYVRLHRSGIAHSVETWIDGELVGGLYTINIGTMVFGESMFSHQSNASKIALAALVAFCRSKQVAMIDCQQDTPHLATLGAKPIARRNFLEHVAKAVTLPSPEWSFEPIYWQNIFSEHSPPA